MSFNSLNENTPLIRASQSKKESSLISSPKQDYKETKINVDQEPKKHDDDSGAPSTSTVSISIPISSHDYSIETHYQDHLAPQESCSSNISSSKSKSPPLSLVHMQTVQNHLTCPSCSANVNLPKHHHIIDATPYEWIPPENVKDHPYQPHAGEGSQYLRDCILGVNDGLVSTLLVVVGMVGGGAESRFVLLSALTTSLSGSISMGIGEYIATKSQNQVLIGDIKLEREHFVYHRDGEVKQLRNYLMQVGLEEGPLLEAVVSKVASNDKHLMKVMERFEFGDSLDNLNRNPLTAMLMSGRLFALGSIPSILPFFQEDTLLGLYVALFSAAICLFFVGAYKTLTTGGNAFYGGLENFLAGAFGAAISFALGTLFEAFYHDQ